MAARDSFLLFTARCGRMFAYGSLSVVLVLYLVEVGLHVDQIGWLLTLTLLGDTAISLWLTTRADRWGRRRTLIVGAILMALAGVAFAATSSFLPLLIAATIGVISPSGNEVGPFLSIEQAALSQTLRDDERTRRFRLVQPGRLRRHGARCIGRRRRVPPGGCGGHHRPGRVSAHCRGLCRDGRCCWPECFASYRRRRKRRS